MGPDNRPLDLEWLEDFVALAESGNFSRAAEARAIAQPAFSPPHPLARGVGRRRPDRPRRASGRADRRRPQVPAARARRAREPRGGADQGAARAGRGGREPALRRHARAVDHVLPALAGRARDAPAARTGRRRSSDHSRACEDLMTQRRVQFVLCYGHRRRAGPAGRGPLSAWSSSATTPCVPVSAPGPRRRAAARARAQRRRCRSSTTATHRGWAASCARSLRHAASPSGKAAPRLDVDRVHRAQRIPAEDDGARRPRRRVAARVAGRRRTCSAGARPGGRRDAGACRSRYGCIARSADGADRGGTVAGGGRRRRPRRTMQSHSRVTELPARFPAARRPQGA